MSSFGHIKVQEEINVCQDWADPHDNLMDIFASEIVNIAASQHQINYRHDCYRTNTNHDNNHHPTTSTTTNTNTHHHLQDHTETIDLTTVQQALPTAGLPIHTNTLSYDHVKNLCSNCLSLYSNHLQNQANSKFFSTSGTIPNPGAHHCILFPSSTKPTSARSFSSALQKFRRPIENYDDHNNNSSNNNTNNNKNNTKNNNNHVRKLKQEQIHQPKKHDNQNQHQHHNHNIHNHPKRNLKQRNVEKTNNKVNTDIIQAILPAIQDRLQYMAIDVYPLSNPPPGETESGVIIYMDHQSEPVPLYHYSHHIPSYVTSIHILVNPLCVANTSNNDDNHNHNPCIIHALKVQSFLSMLYSNINTEIYVMGSTAATFSRMINSHILLCPPCTPTCILPAISKKIQTNAILLDDSHYTYQWLTNESWLEDIVTVARHEEEAEEKEQQEFASKMQRVNNQEEEGKFEDKFTLSSPDPFLTESISTEMMFLPEEDTNSRQEQKQPKFQPPVDTNWLSNGVLKSEFTAIQNQKDMDLFDQEFSRSIDQTLLTSPPDRLNCQQVRGKVGQWMEKALFSEKDSKNDSNNHNLLRLGNHNNHENHEKSSSQAQRTLTYHWKETSFPTCDLDQLNLTHLCQVADILNIERFFFLGDILQAQMVLSFWSLLGLGQYPGHKHMEAWNREISCPPQDTHTSDGTATTSRTIEIVYARNDALVNNDQAQVSGNESNLKVNFPWIDTYRNSTGLTVLVASTGAYTTDFEEYKTDLDKFIQSTLDMVLERPNDIVFYRTSAPGNHNCMDTILTPEDFEKYNQYATYEFHYRERGRRKFENEIKRRNPDEASSILSQIGSTMISDVNILDVYPMTKTYPTTSIGQYPLPNGRKEYDCAHDYAPGPQDWWNHLLFTNLMDMAKEHVTQHRKRVASS